MTDKGLHKFELVQLVNLYPERIEEAKELIPRCVAAQAVASRGGGQRDNVPRRAPCPAFFACTPHSFSIPLQLERRARRR